jgi:hypothetical protein
MWWYVAPIALCLLWTVQVFFLLVELAQEMRRHTATVYRSDRIALLILVAATLVLMLATGLTLKYALQA